MAYVRECYLEYRNRDLPPQVAKIVMKTRTIPKRSNRKQTELPDKVVLPKGVYANTSSFGVRIAGIKLGIFKTLSEAAELWSSVHTNILETKQCGMNLFE